ncbi:MAG: FeoB-associated Cys-rich membrane protein [Clostridiales bacterium]|nr:FeoB-associated Cys-rich membrane protein [Clostridiales bacterium]MBR4010283.1 FeoB-associated Cys-rich membrane protein [Clostridiales bacterium]
MNWIADNLGSIITGLVVIALVAVILAKLVSNKKKGKSSCGCNCSCCPAGGMCHRNEKDKQINGGLSGEHPHHT